jgi:hypothetical protein
MTSDKVLAATLLQNRLLNSAFNRGREVKKGFTEPFTDSEIRSCKVSLKLIRKAHFKLADKILKHYCPAMWQAVFN